MYQKVNTVLSQHRKDKATIRDVYNFSYHSYVNESGFHGKISHDRDITLSKSDNLTKVWKQNFLHKEIITNND